MQNDIEKPCLYKRATVLKCKDGIATLRVHTDSDGCQSCSGSKQNTCALYAFGSIFSRHRDTWQVPSKQPLRSGDRVLLSFQSNTLLKIAAGCYGLPIAVLLGATTLSHLFLSIEWLTILVGLGSLAISYLSAKQWLRSIRSPDIELIQ